MRDRADVVARQGVTESGGHALVEQDLHAAGSGASSLSPASFMTAATWAGLTVGKSSKKSSSGVTGREVVEERANRDARAREAGRAVHDFGVYTNRGVHRAGIIPAY